MSTTLLALKYLCTNAPINEMPHSPLPGQGGDLPLGGNIPHPLGPKFLANCIPLRYYNLKKYAKAPPLHPHEVVKEHTNPHPGLGGVGWGISLICA